MKVDENVDEIRGCISLALDVLQLRDHKTILDDINEVRSLVEVLRTTQISSVIRDWLRAPDATINHQAACAKRHPGTGIWFVKGSVFSDWLTQGNSFLWLNGFAGCGKSVLCSTAIQYAFRHKRHNQGLGIAFFYFTFSDESKQDESAMLRALLLQLSSQRPDSHAELAQLYSSYSPGTPPPEVLRANLRHLIRKFDEVYLLLDALDESPRPHKRTGVLSAIQEMRSWLFPGLHLLITSRNEHDIRRSLNPEQDAEIIMKNAEINQDIGDFISGQLTTDADLLDWSTYHDRIRQVLSEKAQGVFRWVECQLQALKDCPHSEDYLEECLQSLPQDLDKTYERILCSINKAYVEDARRILTLLCFSSRPLTVGELADGVAVELREPARLNFKRRLHNVNDFLKLCPGLIVVSNKVVQASRYPTGPTLRIAHFSVQEYLESDRIKQQKACAFALESQFAHAEIARICIVYLLDQRLSSGSLDAAKLKEFPLAPFAARFWHHHYKNVHGTELRLDHLALALFQQPQESFCNLTRLYNPDGGWRGPTISLDSANIAGPLYHASLLGLSEIVLGLINACSYQSNQLKDLFNTRGGNYGDALQAASLKGHEKVAQILIDAGANVNSQGGAFGTALQAASFEGYEKLVLILMDAGANVNTQGGDLSTALQAASNGGHEKLVQLLLDRGADVNAQGGDFGNAIQAASYAGHEKVVQILLDRGADINSQGTDGTALRAASLRGRRRVVQILLDRGADINAQGRFGTALQAALEHGKENVVKILRDRGALEDEEI